MEMKIEGAGPESLDKPGSRLEEHRREVRAILAEETNGPPMARKQRDRSYESRPPVRETPSGEEGRR